MLPKNIGPLMPHFHLIANAHLDPVWLWDWREGLNEGLVTCRTVLDLMDEFPELTFTRGEAAVYEHIELHDPEMFERIRAKIARGRWDVVGGTYVQPDTNLPATEVLVRQFQRGTGYFKRAFGVRPTAAWAPDSFGHSAGWPAIYSAAGMKSLAFSRPFSADLALPGPAFWWESPGGSRVLAWRMPIGWYGSTRDELPGRLDRYKAEAPRWGLENIAVFFGLGNHGGGPSRAQIEAILHWRDRNPDIAVEFSSLHRFFAALSTEAAKLRTFRGELNFALRGCYASAASFKFAYRRTENALLATERTAAAIAAVTQTPPANLGEAWDAVLFNTFHDILPGTSIERAFIDQQAWIGLAYHSAKRAELEAMNRLAAIVETSVPPAGPDAPTFVPVLVWNSLPVPFDGPVEFEIPLDYRPLEAFRGKPDEVPLEVRDAQGHALPFQCVVTENNYAPETPWRKRFIARLRIPACGWHVLTAGLSPGGKRVARRASDLKTGENRISNRVWSIRAAVGAKTIDLARHTLRVITLDDPWGAWGGHDGEREANHINTVTAVWKIGSVQLLERGPERAALWVRLCNGGSWIELTFQLYRDDTAVVVRARAFWAEKAARLKLEFSAGGEAEFEVPGGRIRRSPCGEVPGGRWVRVGRRKQGFVFASDALYNFDLTESAFGATVVRSCRHTASYRSTPAEQPWRPYMDLGEHLFQFALGSAGTDPAKLAQRLESPPMTMIAPAQAGSLGRMGGVLRLSEGVQLLAFTSAVSVSGWLVRVQNTRLRSIAAAAVFLGTKLSFGRIAAGNILTVLLQANGETWNVTLVNALEEPNSPKIEASRAPITVGGKARIPL